MKACRAADPADRPRNAQQVLDALQACLAEEEEGRRKYEAEQAKAAEETKRRVLFGKGLWLMYLLAGVCFLQMLQSARHGSLKDALVALVAVLLGLVAWSFPFTRFSLWPKFTYHVDSGLTNLSTLSTLRYVHHAEKHFDMALELLPEKRAWLVKAILKRAKELRAAGKVAQAEAACRQALRLQPDNVKAQQELDRLMELPRNAETQ